MKLTLVQFQNELKKQIKKKVSNFIKLSMHQKKTVFSYLEIQFQVFQHPKQRTQVLTIKTIIGKQSKQNFYQQLLLNTTNTLKMQREILKIEITIFILYQTTQLWENHCIIQQNLNDFSQYQFLSKKNHQFNTKLPNQTCEKFKGNVYSDVMFPTPPQQQNSGLKKRGDATEKKTQKKPPNTQTSKKPNILILLFVFFIRC
eukprot:TRINITY_DN4854_c2_g1_i1.p1 TRINITY_DN4854_c2_g1~~TRINITY_DN4854_c2_g1_i1.p1  ORF type:complete len:201 (+),score=3.89 TRINITY_DN4854_c2_g1_i1:460-1062(+)